MSSFIIYRTFLVLLQIFKGLEIRLSLSPATLFSGASLPNHTKMFELVHLVTSMEDFVSVYGPGSVSTHGECVCGGGGGSEWIDGIRKRTLSLGFLGIISRVLRLEVSTLGFCLSTRCYSWTNFIDWLFCINFWNRTGSMVCCQVFLLCLHQ